MKRMKTGFEAEWGLIGTLFKHIETSMVIGLFYAPGQE
jgi:hypothetical protein